MDPILSFWAVFICDYKKILSSNSLEISIGINARWMLVIFIFESIFFTCVSSYYKALPSRTNKFKGIGNAYSPTGLSSSQGFYSIKPLISPTLNLTLSIWLPFPLRTAVMLQSLSISSADSANLQYIQEQQRNVYKLA